MTPIPNFYRNQPMSSWMSKEHSDNQEYDTTQQSCHYKFNSMYGEYEHKNNEYFYPRTFKENHWFCI